MSGVRRWFLSVEIACISVGNGTCALAQIIPDSTLPNNSNVIQSGNTFNITGGTQASGNLFHSFQEFSVPTGSTAFFNNALDIQNIISRVTGSSVSNIDGLIRARGPANLFLLNPNGIIFGPNASLNVGGSFVATTASAIKFGEQGFFSATNLSTPELLTVNPSAFLFNQIAAASIQVNSAAPAGLNPTGSRTFGLRVRDGRSLMLVGGNISMDGGQLKAFGGRVELGSASGVGTIGLKENGNNLSLSFPDNVMRADVSLTNRASVNVRAGDGGSIVINAQNLNIDTGSRLLAGIDEGLGSISSTAGDIEINAKGIINLSSGFIANDVAPLAIGKSGNVNITAKALSVTDGFMIISSTFGKGDAGNITITASDTISFDNMSAAFSTVESRGEGNGGSININTGALVIKNSSQLATFTQGQGDAGSLNINARNTVSFDGGIDNELFSSMVGSSVEFGAIGNGGKVNITARSLAVTNGAQITVGTRGQGNGGSLTINASDTVFFDKLGAAFSSVSLPGEGNGGSININTGSLVINNKSQLIASTNGKGDAGNVNINARDTVSFDGGFAFSTVQPTASGSGGDVRITARQLNVQNDGQVSVSSEGIGNAGLLTVNADEILLDKGKLLGTTASGRGGDIRLNIRDLILMRSGSAIATTADNDGKGGNININSPFVIAVPNENSDIIANANKGPGGRIKIKATGIYGFLRRESLTSKSDINASSNIEGLSGVIEVNIPDFDASTGLVELPVNLVDVSQQVATGCNPGGRQRKGSFTATGRSGLPPSPTEPLTGDSVLATWVTPPSEVGRIGGGDRTSLGENKTTTPNSPTQIVEAQSWVMDGNGDIVLVAVAPTATPDNPTYKNASCPAS